MTMTDIDRLNLNRARAFYNAYATNDGRQYYTSGAERIYCTDAELVRMYLGLTKRDGTRSCK